ncbi:ribosomal protein L7/L12 [Gelidibacter maritimus]|uniref:Ribosomal protein L7/L12 n=1 Tax=Gelidibacter maritimus TaxID=2761487 RepID=A0A7W2M3R7_9FLAO|nr:ribosomal protein L7/L12 [Gelidibacter maritimus]MBA6152168.1 ribosomal protein L7/L12 [Gelidibacter maritimus]
MKTLTNDPLRIIITGLFLLMSFLGNSKGLNALYVKNYEQSKSMMSEMNLMMPNCQLADHLIAMDDDKNTTSNLYEVFLSPVGHRKSEITRFLISYLGEEKIDHIENLVNYGGIVNTDLKINEANALAKQLKKLGAIVKIKMLQRDLSDDMFLVRLLSAGTNKTAVIKVVREIREGSLQEAEQIVNHLGVVQEDLNSRTAKSIKRLLESVGASAKIENMTSPNPQNASLQSNNQLSVRPNNPSISNTNRDISDAGYSVKLLSAGTNKTAVIKVVREIRGGGLKEAEQIVNHLGVVQEDLNSRTAKSIKRLLESVGASAKIENMTSPNPQNASVESNNQLSVRPINPSISNTNQDLSDAGYSVKLLSAGTNKTAVSKVVREIRTGSLKEAERIVNELDIVQEDINLKTAERVKNLLESVGARVKIQKKTTKLNKRNREIKSKSKRTIKRRLD